MNSSLFSILLLIGVISSSSAEFSRKCSYGGDCNFSNGLAGGQVFLRCESGQCVCKEPVHKFMDVAHFPVSLVNGQCLASYNAPCGTSDGITIECGDEGKKCVEGRCRADSDIRSRPINYSCSEDIDCQVGLVCKQRAGSFPFSKYCQKP